MLNISNNSIEKYLDLNKYKSGQLIGEKKLTKNLYRVIGLIFTLIGVCMFLPWTQNIRAKGYVTTLNPYDRPQTVQSLLGGRIEKWYVSEGQLVQAGDTILIVSEVKEEYLDPQLLANTNDQINAKNASSQAYIDKTANLQDQIIALQEGRNVKLKQITLKYKQTQLKIQSDSIDLEAAKVKRNIAKAQLERTETMYSQGLTPLKELELKRGSYQESLAKVTEIQNKMDMGFNDLLSLNQEKIAIDNEVKDKIAKSRSEINAAMSNKFDTDATVDKLQSQYNSYQQRANNYVIKSPITGYVTRAVQSGIGEIIKNGEEVVTIMPQKYQLAIEMFVEPMDLPLIKKNQKVMIQFDGWPAIVFSGWPNSSFGTFAGRVYAIDNFISKNGQYRLLVAEDPNDRPWPTEVRVGGGANTISLLQDVSVGYELWRQLNGFPPNYYNATESNNDKSIGKK